MLKVKRLNKKKDFEGITRLFSSVFTKEPWLDDWSDENKLYKYIKDLTLQANSLSLGLYLDDELIGIALGRVVTFYDGVQYRIDELCIKSEKQNSWYGSKFLDLINDFVKKKKYRYIILNTDRNVYAYNFYLKNGYQENKTNVMLYQEVK